MRWSASLLYPYLLIEIVLIYMSRPSHDQEPTRGPHSFHHRHCDRNCSCFLLNACLSAGFAAEQTVGLRAVDDQKAVTMIHQAPQIFISQAKTTGEFQQTGTTLYALRAPRHHQADVSALRATIAFRAGPAIRSKCPDEEHARAGRCEGRLICIGASCLYKPESGPVTPVILPGDDRTSVHPA